MKLISVQIIGIDSKLNDQNSATIRKATYFFSILCVLGLIFIFLPVILGYTQDENLIHPTEIATNILIHSSLIKYGHIACVAVAFPLTIDFLLDCINSSVRTEVNKAITLFERFLMLLTMFIPSIAYFGMIQAEFSNLLVLM